KRLSYDVFRGENFERAQKLLDELDVIANESGKTVAQIVVNWCLHQPAIGSVLCGAKRDWQIRETAGAMGWRLSKSQNASLESLLS
ncbi:MAG: aldo/keto reductase, partial [Bacteroidota bacterium]